jgi:nicotinate-nucleotide pyrophosphorylase (carboxylating)
MLRYFETIIESLRGKQNPMVDKTEGIFYLFSKEEGIVSGLDEVQTLLNLYDIDIVFRKHKNNGQTVKRGDLLCSMQGEKDAIYLILPSLTYLVGKMMGLASLVRLYQSKLQNASVIDLGEFFTYEAGIASKAMKDGGATTIDLFKIDEVMVDMYGNRSVAIEKAKEIQKKPVMIEIIDIQQFYDIESSNVDYICLKYFNDEAIRRVILDNHGKKRLIIGGLILPQRLDVIGSYQFDFLHTTLFTNAARIYDIGVKVGI